MNDKYEIKEGQGSLWHENNCKVIRKGKIKNRWTRKIFINF